MRDRQTLSRHIAEVIADLYRRDVPPRDEKRMLDLVQFQILHVIAITAKETKAEIEAAAKFASAES